jgi:hypothetical protein
VVSVELIRSSSCGSDEPEAAGDDELSLSTPDAASWFIATRTEAASRSCTCWCFEISSFEVYCHSGVCSQLSRLSTCRPYPAYDYGSSTILRRKSRVKVRGRFEAQVRSSEGYPQMLGKTAAVLVPFPTFFTSQVGVARPLRFPLAQARALASTPYPCFAATLFVFWQRRQ